MIDDDAKSVVLPLIRGEVTSVLPEAQLFLARWFTKMTIVADARSKKSIAITQSHRDYLMQQKLPPPSWEVWIASYNGTDWRDLGFFQRSGMLDFTPVTGPGANFSGYTASGFAGIGKLVALVIGNDVKGMEFDVGTFRNLARRIWPLNAAFDWPLPPIGDIEAAAAADILQTMIGHIRRN